MNFTSGMKVRYRYANRLFGVLDRRVQGRAEVWWVLWENGKRIQAHEENLEIIEGAAS
jgi:hypothetical protein